MTSITELLKKKQQETQDKRMGSKNPYKFKNGITTIRILPGWRGEDDPTFFHSFGQSFIKNQDGKVLAVIGCRKCSYGEDDPIRNLIQQAQSQARTDAQAKLWKDALAKPRELMNALVLDDKEVDPNVPEIVDFSATMLEQIIEQVQLNDIGETFLDLEEGFNLKVSRTGSGFNTKYTFVFDRKPTSVSPSVMENLNDLDAFVRSKMADTDRAINAIKSITTGGEHLQIEDKNHSYSGDDTPIEAEYSSVDDDEGLPWEAAAENRKETVSEDYIDNLFGDDD